MARCYGCNSKIPSGQPVIRREVYTGSGNGVGFSSRRVSASFRSYYGLRVMCNDCAVSYDNEQNQPMDTGLVIAIGIILFGVFYTYCMISSNGSL